MQIRKDLLTFGSSSLLLTALLLLEICSADPAYAQKSFFGLRLGMPAAKALHALGKPSNALEGLPYITGRKILHDTMRISHCKVTMKRSIGFDSSSNLAAIGLTYKTTPEHASEVRRCAYEWLRKSLGRPAAIDSTEGVPMEVWYLGPAKVTLEAKAYNPHDSFVMIYYYKKD